MTRKIRGLRKSLKRMVRLARIERATHSLEGCCSIRLSYRRIGMIGF